MADRSRNFPPQSSEGNPGSQSGSGHQASAPEGHWLCSELVTVVWADGPGAARTQVANLEEIWSQGAILDAEEFVPGGTGLRLSAESNRDELHATVSECRRSATGFALSVEFHAGSEWSPDRFPLAHAVNSRELQNKAAEAAAANPHTHPEAEAGAPAITPADRAADEAVEQGSLFCLALQATRR